MTERLSRTQRDLQRLTGRRGVREGKAILWGDLDALLAEIATRSLASKGKFTKAIGAGGPGDEVDVGDITSPVLDAPSGLAITSTVNAITGVAFIYVDWDDVEGATGYELGFIIDDGNEFPVYVPRSNFENSVIAGQTISVRVRAINALNVPGAWSAYVNHVAAMDDTPPPVPTNIVITTAFNGLWLKWDDSPAADIARYEIFESLTTTPAPTSVTTPTYRTTSSTFFRGSLASGTTRHFWIRAVDYSENASAWSDIASGTTVTDPAELLNLLTGRLTESQLYVDLGARIDLIDGPDTLENSVAARILSESTARANETSALASDITTIFARASVGTSQALFNDQWLADGALAEWEVLNGTGERSIVSVSNSPVGALALRIGNNTGNDEVQLAHTNLIPFDPDRLYRIIVIARKIAGTGTANLGFAGVLADGETFCNTSGGTVGFTLQYYHAENQANIPTAWTTYVGYTKGFGSPNGTGAKGTKNQPGKMHEDVRYLRPYISANAAGVAGITEIAAFKVDDVTDIEDLTAAIQTEATTRADQTGELYAKYAVKIDVNGYVSGFGLASTANDAAPFSEFIIRADAFAVASPAGPGITPAEPFFVRTTSTTIGGQTVPPGVYIRDAFIENGIITSAKIADATITDAKIVNLTAAKLTAGTAIANSITVNGQALGTVQTNANDPGARINAASTQIDPGKITISGASTLYDWTASGDRTTIDGGKIFTNSITAGSIDTTDLTADSAFITNLTSTGTAFMNQLLVKTANIDDAQITTAKIGDAQITTAKIGNLAVDTLQIAGNAVTVPLSQTLTNTVTGNGSYQEIQWLNITLDYPGNIIVIWNGLQSYLSSSGGHNLEIRIDGSAVQNRGGFAINDYPNLSYAGYFAAGTYRVSIYWNAGTGIQVKNRTLIILGAMK